MKILGLNITTSKAVDVDEHKSRKANIIERITERQVNRQKEDVKKWRDATLQAERVHPAPDRSPLVRIYKDVVLDAHLSSLMSTVKHKCLASGYWLEDKDGKVMDKETTTINQAWFREAIVLAIDSLFWGHSLIQLGDIKDDKFTSVKLVPRENVVPELHLVKKEVHIGPNTSGRNNNTVDLIDYTRPLYKPWVLEAGRRDDFGLLHKATPHVLWKKNVTSAWAQYGELFGMPLRVGKTDILDPNKKQNMIEMLTNVGQAAWALMDEEDTIDFIETNNEDAYEVFKQLMNFCNAEMSKLILGQTMTTEDGSSRSQAEVHENVMNDYITSVKWWLADWVNNTLLPVMVGHSLIPDGLSFTWDNTEKVTLKEKFDMVVDLLNAGKNVPDEFIHDQFGIELDEAIVTLPTPAGTADLGEIENRAEGTSVMRKVFDAYAGYEAGHTHKRGEEHKH